MTDLEKLTDVFVETFGIDAETVQGLQYQSIEAWDSVGHMALIAAIEDAFGITMDTDDIIDLSSFEKARQILLKYELSF